MSRMLPRMIDCAGEVFEINRPRGISFAFHPSTIVPTYGAGQAQRLIRLTVSGIFDRRIGPKDYLWTDTINTPSGSHAVFRYPQGCCSPPRKLPGRSPNLWFACIDRETYVSGEIDNLMGGNDGYKKKPIVRTRLFGIQPGMPVWRLNNGRVGNAILKLLSTLLVLIPNPPKLRYRIVVHVQKIN